jgi:hypothetical protein
MPGPILSASAAAATAPTADGRARADAARAFEALLIARLLAAARADASGPEADRLSLGERAVAEAIAEAAPFGIERLLEPRP